MEPRLPLRQDSGHRLLLPPKGFRVPAGRGLGHGDIKIGLGTKRREVMLLWQARSRGFRIHRSSSRSGPMVGFSATSCSNSDNPAGAFTSFSHFRTPNVTGQALSQPASA